MFTLKKWKENEITNVRFLLFVRFCTFWDAFVMMLEFAHIWEMPNNQVCRQKITKDKKIYLILEAEHNTQRDRMKVIP